MPRYRLLSAHYSEEDKWLPGDKEAADSNGPITGYQLDEKGNQVLDEKGQPIAFRGTVVGDGTPHKWTRDPTPDMVGLDEESQALVEIAKKRGDGLDPVDRLPLTVDTPQLSLGDLQALAERAGFRLVPEKKHAA
jgi:hypothetical protein